MTGQKLPSNFPCIADYLKISSHASRVSGGVRPLGKEAICHNLQDEPLVSVITVVLNDEAHIEETILSVLNQSYKNIEYIIIDGASSDNTIDILRKYSDYLDLWISEPDNSIYDAMNKGIAMARGKYVKLLNSGDILEKDAVKKVVRESNELADLENTVISSIMSIISDDLELIGNIAEERKTFYWWSDMKPHPSWYVPKIIYQKYGLYSLKYRIASDREFYFRLKDQSVNFRVIQNPLVKFRLNGCSQSSKGAIESYFIHKQYFGVKKALLMFIVAYPGKIRTNMFLRLFGSKNTDKIRICKNKLIENLKERV